MNISELDRKNIDRAIKMYYKHIPNAKLSGAYTKMLNNFYVDRYVHEGKEEKKILKPLSQCPTLRQF